MVLYGAKPIRAYISGQRDSYGIPPQSSVSDPWPVDWRLDKQRIWFRSIAARYDSWMCCFVDLAQLPQFFEQGLDRPTLAFPRTGMKYTLHGKRGDYDNGSDGANGYKKNQLFKLVGLTEKQ
ncbi:hypothetical protein D7X33_17290 [Butyricicoccus sp. 1XD8-22]|nr:hypothetical protein D7X33_17290 [Butyricicoccus sp. 1XD8-22]